MNYHKRLFHKTLIVTLTLVSGWTLTRPSLAQKQPTGIAPISFTLPKTKYDEQSHWKKINANYYLETYPHGSRTPSHIYRIGGRMRLNGIAGTIAYRPNIKVFIPDVGSGSSWVGLYWKARWNKKWNKLTNVQPRPKTAAAPKQRNKR
jgi:hypothetical protein